MRRSATERKTGKEQGNWVKVGFLATAVLAAAGVVFHFPTAAHPVKAGATNPAADKALPSQSVSLPLFFEPNQGQTAPQVKFLAHGAGYGLFLTAGEAVLQLQPSAVKNQHSGAGLHPSALNSEAASSSVIRMRLDGASSSAHISGASPLPGKSNYIIGNDPSKWRHDIPQFARVEYQAVYPGIDLDYYGNQGQLEYDFRVAPGADPNQIALSFTGATARIVSGDSGDLILSTASGDVRFHAPHVYQPGAPEPGNASGNAGKTIGEKTVTGSFRQLADNKIGFTIGAYDHSRELVIDPVLTYSTYLGGSLTESLVKIAVDAGTLIYVAGSTNSADFPLPPAPNPNPPIQATLKVPTATNIFIAVINSNPNPQNPQQLLFATYLGGSQVDSLAGIAVDQNLNIYVAGFTTSADFPTTTTNAFQTSPAVAGTHGFLSRISLVNAVYNLAYSTYLAGNGADMVTGLAVDGVQNAYVTGNTTSSNAASDGFPANPNGFQTVSNSPGNPQFFASKINTAGSGPRSMLYSTYFGGGFPAIATAVGGGIAVDPSGASVNMYFTGTTNMLAKTPSGEAPFPIFNAQQACLNEASQTNCISNSPTTTTDAFVAKINPNQPGSNPVYSTFIGGSGDEQGLAIAVDTTGNAYVTGSTSSTDWVSPGTGFQTSPGGGPPTTDAFVAKIGNLVGSTYPLNYFSYIGGSGNDSGQDIKVDSVQAVRVAGTTNSTDLVLTTDALQGYGGGGDAFVALIQTTLAGRGVGDYLTYLGGTKSDQGTGVAIDVFGATYVAGTTQSSDFLTFPPPPSLPPYQAQLNGPQDAFVSKIGATSALTVTAPTTSPSPNPVAAGTQVAFTFTITNTGPDTANLVVFNALNLPVAGLSTTPTARVTSGLGSCGSLQGSTIPCFIPTLAVNAQASVEVDITPSDTANPALSQITIAGTASANGGQFGGSVSQGPANVVDFGISVSTSTPTINAGDTAVVQVVFAPTTSNGYNAIITPSQSTLPSMVTATTPAFNPTTVTLSGSAPVTTLLSIATVARPVTTGGLFRRGSFYATWLPIGGLSLVGLGIGAGRKRRRWLAGALLGLIAGVILVHPGCGTSNNTVVSPAGTQAGQYTITVLGTAGTASHSKQVTLHVN